MVKKAVSSILTSLILFFCACAEAPKDIKMLKYFDIPAFFKEQAERLDASKPQITKVLQTNGEEETLNSKPASWKEELSIFSSINLNKSSYIGKYLVDSTFEGKSVIIEYTTNDKKLPVKNCKFKKTEERLDWIEIKKLEHSLVLNSELFWRFIPDSGYFVSGSQQIAKLDPSIYKVSVIFAN